MRFSPEYRLAVASVGWPPSEDHACALHDALDATVDWERFLCLVARHRIAPLANHTLSRPAMNSRVPEDVRTRLAAAAFASARVSLQMQAETLRVHQVFMAAGIPVTFLKGVPLAHLVYGSVALRHSKDIDVLVAPDLTAGAAAVLEAAGYERQTGPAALHGSRWQFWLREFHHCSLVHPATGIEIELHWRLFRNPRLLPLVPGSAARGQVQLSNGTALSTLADDDNFSYLCAHGTVHNWFRLKWLADVGTVLNQRSESDVERLYEAARGRGAGLFAAHAMLLAHHVLGSRLPAPLVRRLGNVEGVLRLERGATSVLFGSTFQQEPVAWKKEATAQYEWQLMRLGGLRYKAAQLRTILVSQEDVQAFALPRAAAFTYPLVRAPIWVWRQVRQKLRPERNSPNPGL
jgi:hypothetical protein